MKRNTTIHLKTDFYTTLCGCQLFKNGEKTNCRATGNIKFVTCKNCINAIPKTGAANYGDDE